MRKTRVIVCVLLAGTGGVIGDLPALAATHDLGTPPVDAVFCPADYDGDGLTDLAVKGSNGVWYIDVAACSWPGQAETACANFIDDDNDGLVNDGCPSVGTAEAVADVHACEPPYYTVTDDDDDSYVDDGCPTNRQCLGGDGFGGRWDFAYPGYGDTSAAPIPADYGSVAGPADGKADLAIKDTSGIWAIDYADNGFGTFDVYLTGYGFDDAVPWPADYDGDGRADLSVRSTDGTGAWFFDYSSDGFGKWNIPCGSGCPCTVQPGAGQPVLGYGGDLDTPAPGDFDGDGCADLSVKDQTGHWFFDLAFDGFHGWQAPCPGCSVPLSGYGDHTNKPIVANYDPGFDVKADLAVVTPDGHWAIDFAADGFGTWNTSPFYHSGWGDAGTKLAPGHYTSPTGNLDQAVKDPSGYLYIDKASNGYSHLDLIYSTTRHLDANHPRIDRTLVSTPTPVSSCGDGKCEAGESCVSCVVDCGCPSGCSCDSGGNYRENVVDPATLKIGVRYTANVHVLPGSTYQGPDAIKVNPDLHVPVSLNVENIGGQVISLSDAAVVYQHSRRFAFTCSQWGSFPLGFMFSTGVNSDYGIGVTCTSDHPGLYGTVTNKRTNRPIRGATVTAGGLPATTDSLGFWNLPSLTGGPYTVTISTPRFAPAVAVNVRVPSYPANQAGVQIDTPLEEAFNLPAGITYTTYIDYSRGRTIMHTVEIDVTKAPITLGKAGADPSCTPDANGCGGCWGGPGSDFRRLIDVATAQDAAVMINGIWWTLETSNYVQTGPNVCNHVPGPPFADTRSIGYLYMNGYVSPGVCENGVCRPSDVECSSGRYYAEPSPGRPAASPVVIQDEWQSPLFGVKGSGTQQRASIVMTDSNFLTSSDGWKRVASSQVPNCPSGFLCPIYDKASPDNQSDYDHAFQMGHVLLTNGGTPNSRVIARGIMARIGTAFPSEFAYARTTIGTNVDGTVAWLVVADGEGIDGGNGGTPNQMGEFYRDVLHATNAMIIDSGESTEMVLRGATGQRRVNTISSENHAADGFGPDEDYCPNERVFGYVKVGT